MKYYSEILKKVFDSEQECVEAEAAEKQLTSERKKRAAEVEAARKELQEANTRYNKLLKEYCKDYGAFHYKLNDREDLKDILDFWF